MISRGNRLCWLWLVGGWIGLGGCDSGDDLGWITFQVVRDVPADPGLSNAFPGLRADGIDRSKVKNVLCQVSDSSDKKYESTVVVDALASEQIATLPKIPAGPGYFARLLGRDQANTVIECAVTGPFTIPAGKSTAVTLVIQPALTVEDPGCVKKCTTHGDCPTSFYCGNRCADLTVIPPTEQCTKALCRPLGVGERCAENPDCGVDGGLSCLSDAQGFKDGYCTAACVESDGASCRHGSQCAPIAKTGLAVPICARACTTDTNCRPSYHCVDLGAGDKGCLPGN